MGLRESDFFDSEDTYLEVCGSLSPEDLENRNEAYISLFEALNLTEQHKHHLLGRGFTDSEIESFAFRSADSKSLAPLSCAKIVPGFSKGNGWKRVNGILIPCISPEGQFWAVKVKNDNGSPKYFWYSSSGNLGKVFAYHSQGKPKFTRVIEGVLKSCLAHAILARKEQDFATIGIGGVNVWKGVIEYYKGREKQRFVISFDQDNKQATTTEIERFREALLADGHEVSVELWNPEDGKGIDDVLHSGRATRIIPWGKNDPRPRGLPGSPAGDYGGFKVRKASEITPTLTEWIIPNMLPKGYLVQLAGGPGVGKGFFTAFLAKHLTKGTGFQGFKGPDKPQTVLILNEEDDVDSVQANRVAASGVEKTRCLFAERNGGIFTLPKNIEKLEYLILDTGANVIFIDPMPSFLDNGLNYSSDPDSRPVAVALAALVKKLNVCIAMVFHTTKGNGNGPAMNRASGAQAWVGQCRKAYLIEYHPESKDKRVLINTKSNLAPFNPIYEFTIESDHDLDPNAKAVWGGLCSKTEDEILNKGWKRK